MHWKELIAYMIQHKQYNFLLLSAFLILQTTVSKLQELVLWIYNNGKPPYENKVWIKRIVLRYAPDKWLLDYDQDFLALHCGFFEPTCLLDNTVHLSV